MVSVANGLTMEVNSGRSFTNVLQNIFCVQEKENDTRMSKWWNNVYFGCTKSLRCLLERQESKTQHANQQRRSWTAYVAKNMLLSLSPKCKPFIIYIIRSTFIKQLALSPSHSSNIKEQKKKTTRQSTSCSETGNCFEWKEMIFVKSHENSLKVAFLCMRASADISSIW